jgi:hypothetical protein
LTNQDHGIPGNSFGCFGYFGKLNNQLNNQFNNQLNNQFNNQLNNQLNHRNKLNRRNQSFYISSTAVVEPPQDRIYSALRFSKNKKY